MPWSYSQSTGQLTHNGAPVITGYSGAGMTAATGRNNSSMQNVAYQGPIPQGQWHIGPAHTHHTQHGSLPVAMVLSPVGHNALGRTNFLIHGNNSANNASQGCVILDNPTRHQISTSGDNILNVVP